MNHCHHRQGSRSHARHPPPRPIISPSACGPCPGRARDQFGDATRAPLDPIEAVEKLSELGAWGITFHDDDLIPFGSDAATRDKILGDFRAALDRTGMTIEMVTTNLFTHPGVQGRRPDLATTARSAASRCARCCATSIWPPSSAPKTFVMWGGREGSEYDGSKDLERRLRPLPRRRRHRRRLHQGAGLRHQDRPGAQAERAARRHPAADRRPRARLHRPARARRHRRPEPGDRARADGRPELHPRHRPGAVGRTSSSTST